ncbi:MAG: hypothetical protein R3179_01165 [Sedimenticolaceae bacterium]|nr:hypothetical protein [Sedimenticolaceae bacterium]
MLLVGYGTWNEKILSFLSLTTGTGNLLHRGILSTFRQWKTALKNGKLLIHPTRTECRIDINKVLFLLDSIGFISSNDAQEDGLFPVGERFLQLLTFMGCSPHVRLEPEHPGDEEYVYIRLIESASPLLLASDNSRTPACPNCRKPALSDWSVLEQGTAPLVCRHCGTKVVPETLRWRNDAGIGRFFIEINSIYPGEAQPVASMMQQLGETTGCEWRYFYLLKEKDSRTKKPPEAS